MWQLAACCFRTLPHEHSMVTSLLASATRYVFFGVALLVLSSAVLAQRPPRLVTTQGCAWSGAGSSRWTTDGDGELIFVNQKTLDARTAFSAPDAPGGVHALSQDEALICGTAAGSGVIQRWTYANGVLSLVEQRSDSGMDFVGIVYDASLGFLYALDAVGLRLCKAAWNSQASLSTVHWIPIATASNFPEIADAANFTLTPSGASGTIRMVRYPKIRELQGIMIDVASEPPMATPLAVATGHNAYAIPAVSSEGGTSVWVKAPTGVHFDVVKLSSRSVIGTGIGQGVHSPVTTNLSEALVLGQSYAARVLGQVTPTEFSFECVRRYGASETLSDGTSMTPFFYQLGAVSGSVFNIELALSNPLSRPTSRTYNGYLLAGFRASNDPVVPLGSNYVLNPAFIVPAQGGIVANANSGSISIDVPVPSGLEGLVFLVQYVVEDGSNLRLSQVYGSII